MTGNWNVHVLLVVLLSTVANQRAAGAPVDHEKADTASMDENDANDWMADVKRSNSLNKNFIRFGRSGGHVLDVGELDEFIRAVISQRIADAEAEAPFQVDKKSPSAKQLQSNFIRYGRAGDVDVGAESQPTVGFYPLGKMIEDQHRRFGRGPLATNFIRFGRK